MIAVALLIVAVLLLFVSLSIRASIHALSGQIELIGVQIEGIRDSVGRLEPPESE